MKEKLYREKERQERKRGERESEEEERDRDREKGGVEKERGKRTRMKPLLPLDAVLEVQDWGCRGLRRALTLIFFMCLIKFTFHQEKLGLGLEVPKAPPPSPSTI